MADWEFRGEVLAAARETAGKSKAQLARDIKVANGSRIAVWEQGQERPLARFVPLLARQVGLDPWDLIDGDRDHPDLPHLRVVAGLSIRQVAALIGWPTMKYHRLETRRVRPGGIDDRTVEALAGVLNISPTLARTLT